MPEIKFALTIYRCEFVGETFNVDKKRKLARKTYSFGEALIGFKSSPLGIERHSIRLGHYAQPLVIQEEQPARLAPLSRPRSETWTLSTTLATSKKQKPRWEILPKRYSKIYKNVPSRCVRGDF